MPDQQKIALKDGEFKHVTNYDPNDRWYENRKNWDGLETLGKNSDDFNVAHAATQKVFYFENAVTDTMYVFKTDEKGKITCGAEVSFDGSHTAHGINTEWNGNVDPAVTRYTGPGTNQIAQFIAQKAAGKSVADLDIATAEKEGQVQTQEFLSGLIGGVNKQSFPTAPTNHDFKAPATTDTEAPAKNTTHRH